MTTPKGYITVEDAAADAERRFEEYRQHMHAETKSTGDPELDRTIHNAIDELADETIQEYHRHIRELLERRR